MTTVTDVRRPSAPASPARRVLSQTAFETQAILRNAEQLMVTLALPALILIGLTRSDLVELSTGGAARIDFVAPGVIALAVMSTSFTSQAIATAFDRRNGVLRLLATTPLGRGGLLAGKILAVFAVELVQIVVLGGIAVALGWRPDAAGIPLALLTVVLGTAAFTSLALLIAGTLRSEAVLAVANLLLVLLAVGGGVLMPEQLPGPLADLALLLPSGALGEGLRQALLAGSMPGWTAPVLVAWAAILGWGAARLFRWH